MCEPASHDCESFDRARVNMRVTQLLKANRFKMGALTTVYQRYLKWVLRLKCEIRMARRFSSPI